ncbi:MAG TPA: nucleotidyltransferase domain-containing protein [Polyangiaceae bacterium]|nr:nucleotidyltransferase domain-containing protein [Polyangiaceae bacterium]
MQTDPLVRRIAEEQRRALERADRLRALLPRAVELLQKRGATRVVLFGSLATGVDPHAGTGVDLCVHGLSFEDCADVLLELEALFGSQVDLVHAESAGLRLLRRVARQGKELTHVAR